MSGSLLEQVKTKAGIKDRYDNFINGKWEKPVKGQYFDNTSPVVGKVYSQVARSTAEDIEKALDAAHNALKTWGKTSASERSAVLLKIADALEANHEKLALIESWDKGKPLRESMAADVPMAIDHFRYFAAVIRTQEGGLSQIDNDTVAYHYFDPIGVVGAIIPWNFPLVLAAWKLAPALAAGNTVVLKPAEQAPASVSHFMEIIADILPPGVVNMVHGFGPEAGQPLACSPRVNKLTFTGETSTGSLIMKCASDNIVPVTLELGGKSPNVFFPDILNESDGLADKAIEGFTMFAFNQGEVCTCPSRALVHESIYDKFVEKAVTSVKKITAGNPLELTTMIGAQASKDQMEKTLSYIDIGQKEGGELLAGGKRIKSGGELDDGFYIEPTIFRGDNTMRIFQEEIFGPLVSIVTFKDYDEAIRLANETKYGLSAAVWTRDVNTAYRASRDIEAGRVWVNCYHLYPAHSAFGGYKQSGIGRENHKMMLSHFQQVKNVIRSYDPKPMGFY